VVTGSPMSITEQFLTKSKFSKLVEAVVINKSLSYMEAILHLCEENDIDPEDVRKFISPIIRDKLEAEAMNLNFLPKQNTLIFD
jgi:hypothetical protein